MARHRVIPFVDPATGPLGIVRIDLPKQDQPIEIDGSEIASQTGALTRTEV